MANPQPLLLTAHPTEPLRLAKYITSYFVLKIHPFPVMYKVVWVFTVYTEYCRLLHSMSQVYDITLNIWTPLFFPVLILKFECIHQITEYVCKRCA